jgi:hypothetical protein
MPVNQSSGYQLLSRILRQIAVKRAFHLACLLVFLLGLASLGRAQNSSGRFEAGGSFTVMQSSGAGGGPFGPGIEGAVNFGRHIALDGALNWLPERFSLASGGRIVQALVGAKVGTRFQRFGLFVKVRPGFITTGSALRSVTFDPNQFIFTQRFARLTERALDLGGVIEYYPAKRWSLRYDAGDTMLFEELPTFNNPVRDFGTYRSNHFQFSTSVRYRF